MKESLSPKRRERLSSIRNHRVALSNIGAGYLESQVLSIAPPGTEIIYGIHEKPTLSCGNLFYNLSHSGDLIVCIISDRNIGIDIQEPRKITKGLNERVLSKREMASGCFQEDASWLRLWAVKEAYSKLTGEGLALSFSRLETDTMPDSASQRAFIKILENKETQIQKNQLSDKIPEKILKDQSTLILSKDMFFGKIQDTEREFADGHFLAKTLLNGYALSICVYAENPD